MRVHLYEGGLTSLVAHSGVGQAICHQRAMLAQAGVEQADGWRVAQDRSLARMGQALCGIYEKEARHHARAGQPGTVRTA